jgi:hypothetical protein
MNYFKQIFSNPGMSILVHFWKNLVTLPEKKDGVEKEAEARHHVATWLLQCDNFLMQKWALF